MGSFAVINKNQSGNFWELNPHMIHVKPFSELYQADKSKSKDISSNHMWCILWMTDPDEEVNKYYRVADKEERLNICKLFNPEFDPEHPIIEECLEKYPYLCLNADELAYKMQKDQLIEISQFLSRQEITMDSIGDIIKHKAALPKIYQDFEKIEKMFQKNKSEQRVWGNRKLTARERGTILPDA